MSDQVEQALVIVKLYNEFSQHITIERAVSEFLVNQLGMVPGVDFTIVAGFVDDPRLLPESELASSKQMWFLGKCIADAGPYEGCGGDILTVAIEIARAEMKKPLTKQRASQLIDALKEQTAEAASLAALAKKSQS